MLNRQKYVWTNEVWWLNNQRSLILEMKGKKRLLKINGGDC